jgi:hypothetical protein
MSFTARDKAECAEREVAQRKRVYFRLVGEGKMSGKFADKQIAIMQAIADDYRLQAEADEAKERLL